MRDQSHSVQRLKTYLRIRNNWWHIPQTDTDQTNNAAVDPHGTTGTQSCTDEHITEQNRTEQPLLSVVARIDLSLLQIEHWHGEGE